MYPKISIEPKMKEIGNFLILILSNFYTSLSNFILRIGSLSGLNNESNNSIYFGFKEK